MYGKKLPPSFQNAPAISREVTPAGNVVAAVGDKGNIKQTFHATQDSTEYKRLKVRFTNGSGADYTNLLVFAGFVGLDPDFDLDAAYPSLSISMPEVNTSLALGAKTFDMRSSKNSFYGVISGRMATGGMKINDLVLRTNNRENFDGNRLSSYVINTDGNTRKAKIWELDQAFDPNTTPAVFNTRLKEFEALMINTETILVLDRLKAGTYIEMDFDVPFVVDSAFFSQSN